MEFWVSVWARLRKDEMIYPPEDFPIHEVYLKQMEKTDFVTVFRGIHLLFTEIYEGIAKSPEAYGMPLYGIKKYRAFSPQWRNSAQAPYQPIKLLFYLLSSSEALQSGVYRISVDKFKAVNTVKNPHFFFKALENHGFHFEGLKNHKLTHSDIIMTYGDNSHMLEVLKLMAEKSHLTDRLNDFLCCHFKLFKDDINTADYGFGADDVADRLNSDDEKTFVYQMNEALTNRGMFRKAYEGFEGRGLMYYSSQKEMDTKKPCLYRIVSRSTDIIHNVFDHKKMILMLRVRNVEKCKEYISTCPDSIKEIFTTGDRGCGNRPCVHGVAYELEGKHYWKCGCYAPTLRFNPRIEDMPHYIKLIELGAKR